MSLGRPARFWARTGLCVLALFLTACGDESASQGPTRKASSAGPVVYGRAPHFRLTDQDGAPFGSDELRGEVWVGNFMFTRCLATCPVQTARLVVLQAELAGHAKRGDIHLVSISVDSGHDTPEVLSAYADKNGAVTDRWHFLTGRRRDIWLLSTEGFKLPAGPDPENEAMPIGHSARFVVVDRRGRIRALVDSQAEDSVAKTMAILETLVKEPRPARVGVPPSILEGDVHGEVAAAQRAASASWPVRHDLRFEDARYASGIGFRHRMVDDGGKHYKAVHYDHGNGLAAADVDGDGLLDLYFCNQVGSNRLYRNLGQGRFEDITKRAGVAVSDAVGVSASFADTDNDGDPDLYVTTVRGGNRFFVNDGNGRFRDATESAGLTYSGHSSSAVFFDYDRDGRLDLFLCNVGTYTTDTVQRVIDDATTVGTDRGSYDFYEGMSDGFSGHLKSDRDEASILYRNLGDNRFKDVSADMMLRDVSWTGAATPIDGNDDGWLDLYVLNMQGADAYYENKEGVTFQRRDDVFPKTPWGSMGVKVFDQDGDGDLDLYLTDMHSDMSQVVAPADEKQKSEMLWPEKILQSDGRCLYGNALFRKTGPGAYEEVSDAAGAETFWPWGISTGDVNADGHQDVFVAGGMSYPFRYGINSLLLGDGKGAFLDSEFVLGVEPRPGPGLVPWFDLDCAGADSKHNDCAGHEGPVTVWAHRSSRSSLLIDLDGDGDLDLVTNDFNSEPLVLRSNLNTQGDLRWLGIRLRGTASNRDGLGAVVRVHAGGRTQVQVHDGQSGYLSQSAMPLYFGLGDAARVDKIEVRWLGGATQVIEKPFPIDRVMTIEQAK